VTGRGVIEVVPDLAEVSLGVHVRDTELAAAKAAADAAVGRLLALTAELGIAPADVSSTRLSMGPVYSRADTPELLGYEVSRGLTVTLRDLSQLDALVDRAVEAGANRQFHVALATSRERELRAQAIDLAVADATAQARRLAEGFGATLGPIETVGPPEPGQYVVTGMTDSHGTGTFEPGTLDIRAMIQATFRLEG
ncbi:MAG TPA: SIMPL domain-containing protein, partial [Thermoanaerobaculia bacterium]|nr:SIMPL domain-containing protein [Thermoanaerobaculia bacterium]